MVRMTSAVGCSLVKRPRRALLAMAMLATGPAVAAPQYEMIRRTAEVARPAAQTWAAIGDFCRIGELLSVPCEIVSGTGDVGTLRRLNGSTIETEVGRTPMSYTYDQIEGSRKGLDYHGTLAVEPVGRDRSRIVYTLVLDLAPLPPATDKADYMKQLADRFEGVVQRAKQLAKKGAAPAR